MDERVKRLLYLTEYDNKKNKKTIIEAVESLYESKQTEQQALSILTTSKDIDDVLGQKLINDFKTFDRTKNQALLPIIAKVVIEKTSDGSTISRHLNEIRSLFTSISEMVNSNKITLPQSTETGYVVNNKTFSNSLKLAEFIHGLEGLSKGHAEWKGNINIETDEPPIWPTDPNDKSGIKIYDGNDIGKCIKYTTGGLTGKHYGFCIGQPANTMWQSYRDTKTSTFYYIIDANRELNDPLHIVVLDNTQYGIELTDSSNSTGHIAEYDDDVDGYLSYLKSKGVPTNIFVNKAKTSDEEAEAEKLGDQNRGIEWFKALSFEEKSKYIGRGHLLSDDQFNYLWQFKNDKGGYHLLHQYVDTGQAIPETQFNILVGEE